MLHDIWYIIGGGDNTRALNDTSMLVLPTDLTAPGATARWRAAADEDDVGPGGEGLAVVAVEARRREAGCIVAFGGYNGQAPTAAVQVRDSVNI
jgi:hypothetical protein